VVVIGGGSGIGFAAARMLDRVGADVTLAGRNRDRLLAAASALRRTPRVEVVDVTDPAGVERLIVADTPLRPDEVNDEYPTGGCRSPAPTGPRCWSRTS
jgi:NADP-dependent 3-hydroxy acid dehydrogenase YdfG